jgi:hypothetical protein
MPFHEFYNPILPTERGGVDPRAASSRFAISRTIEGRGATPRESIKSIYFRSESSLIYVNL